MIMNRKALLSVCGLATVALSVSLGGCEKPPPPPPPPPPKVEAPPPPEPIKVDSVLASLRPDARVQFPQERAPIDESLARAVIELANAFAKGDSAKVGSMLDPVSKVTLDKLVADGSFEDVAKKLEGVRIVCLEEGGIDGNKSSSGSLVLAFQEPGSSYVLSWMAVKAGEQWVFTAAPSTGASKTRASEWDGFGFAGYLPSTNIAASSPMPEVPEAATAAAGEEKKEEGKEKAPDGDRKVRTPAGPVTIPGTKPGG
jgi:hypothetical protein